MAMGRGARKRLLASLLPAVGVESGAHRYG